jgi:hypothetical protein
VQPSRIAANSYLVAGGDVRKFIESSLAEQTLNPVWALLSLSKGGGIEGRGVANKRDLKARSLPGLQQAQQLTPVALRPLLLPVLGIRREQHGEGSSRKGGIRTQLRRRLRLWTK